jgi:hypothetical protein
LLLLLYQRKENSPMDGELTFAVSFLTVYPVFIRMVSILSSAVRPYGAASLQANGSQKTPLHTH